MCSENQLRVCFKLRVCQAMTKNGILQHELATKTGIHPVTVSRIITSDWNLPKLEYAVKIAKALNVSLDWLCGLED